MSYKVKALLGLGCGCFLYSAIVHPIVFNEGGIQGAIFIIGWTLASMGARLDNRKKKSN